MAARSPRPVWKVLHLPADAPDGRRSVDGAIVARGSRATSRPARPGSCSTRPAGRTPGGTGRRAPSTLAAAIAREVPGHPGRRPGPGERRRRALRDIPAVGVDVASGVEGPRVARRAADARTRSRSPCSSSAPAPPATTGPNVAVRPDARSMPACSRPTPPAAGAMEREFGGRYVPETLMAALEQLEAAYDALRHDPRFWAELRELLGTFAGRPTPLYRADRLAERSRGGRRARGRRPAAPAAPRSACTSSARTSPTPARTRSTTPSARRC